MRTQYWAIVRTSDNTILQRTIYDTREGARSFIRDLQYPREKWYKIVKLWIMD